MYAENDKRFQVASALVANDWLGTSLVFEAHDTHEVSLSSSISQQEFEAGEAVLRETAELLHQAGIIAFTELDDTFVLTEQGLALYAELAEAMRSQLKR